MNILNDIEGIIFDYGGTLDTNGIHWAEVLWDQYRQLQLPVGKEQFRVAYVHAERTLALNPLIKPTHNFYDVLYLKAGLQLSFLRKEGYWKANEKEVSKYQRQIAQNGYEFVLNVVKLSREVLGQLVGQYKLVLVSNFYGNIRRVLEDFSLLCFFKEIIESSVVGVRKPDPAIFKLGVNALGCDARHVAVVGDSFSKDILPARMAGCRTVWLKGNGWDEAGDGSVPDAVITDLSRLPELFEI